MANKKFLSMIVVMAVLIPTGVGALNFSDVPPENIYELPIHVLRDAGLIVGYPDNTFHPQEYLSRDSGAKVVLSLFESDPNFHLDVPELDVSSQFKDLDVASPVTKYLIKAKQLGIFDADADGYYHPKAPLTRAEFMKLVLVPFGLNLEALGMQQIFSDVPTYAWFAKYMNFAGKYGFILPDNDHNLYPSQLIRRGEAAEAGYLLYIMLKAKDVQLIPQESDNEELLIGQIEACIAKSMDYLGYDETFAAKRLAAFAVGFGQLLYNSEPANLVNQALSRLAKATLYTVNYLVFLANNDSGTAESWLALARTKLGDTQYADSGQNALADKLRGIWPAAY